MSAPSTPEEDGLPKEFLVVDAWSGDDSSSSSQKNKGRHKSRRILSRNCSPENLAISHRKPTEVEIDEFVETLKLANTSDDNGRDNNYNKNLRIDSYNRSSSRRDSRHEDRRRRRSKDERSKRSESSYSRSSYRCRKETKFSSSDRCENVSYKRGVIKKTIFNSRESDVREDRGDYGDRHKILEPSRDRLVFITSDEDNGECVEKNINSFAKEELDYGNRYISEDLRYSILSSRGDNSFSDADIRDDDEYPVDFGDTYEFISESQSREAHQFNARQAYYTQPHYTDYNQCDDAYIGQPPMVMPPSSNVDFYPGVTSGYFPVPHPTPPPPATPSPPPPPKLTDRERTPPPYWESYKTPGGGTEIPLQLKNDIIAKCFKPEKSCYVDYTPYENDPVLAENSRTNIVTPTNSLVVNINDSASVPTKNDTYQNQGLEPNPALAMAQRKYFTMIWGWMKQNVRLCFETVNQIC
ncbi:hypothetical protein AAG570_008666 [Ranatra chinensis]|uniref:Uncharacterized protein n=1 Tax=Ranatra chinensis TaxID=642074 RepID=A0ABD0YRJ2_9HEMI